MDYTPYLFPLVGATIGYLTNYVAVKMLFRPRIPIGLGPFKVQGLLPKRRHDISKSIAATVENELISIRDLSLILKKLDLDPLIDEVVDSSFDSVEGTRKSEILSRINTTINAYLGSRVKKSLSANKDKLIGEFIHEIEKNVDFRNIIENNIEAFDLDQLENIVQRVSSKELRFITIMGGVLGFFVGLLQMTIYMMQ